MSKKNTKVAPYRHFISQDMFDRRTNAMMRRYDYALQAYPDAESGKWSWRGLNRHERAALRLAEGTSFTNTLVLTPYVLGLIEVNSLNENFNMPHYANSIEEE